MKGAILAVGTSIKDTLQLCKDEEFTSYINLAASNLSLSIIIFGDKDIIEELKFVLTDKKKFYRYLRVDMAYYLQYIEPCLKLYINSL